MPSTARICAYRLHNASGQARGIIDGPHHHLGRYKQSWPVLLIDPTHRGRRVNSYARRRAGRINEIWSFDLVSDRTEDSQQLQLPAEARDAPDSRGAPNRDKPPYAPNVRVSVLEMRRSSREPVSIRPRVREFLDGPNQARLLPVACGVLRDPRRAACPNGRGRWPAGDHRRR